MSYDRPKDCVFLGWPSSYFFSDKMGASDSFLLSFDQACDEDVWREIDLFKSCLRRMSAEPTLSTSATTAALADGDDVNSKQSRKNSKKARQGGGGVVFLETGGKPGSSAARHAFIEAVPLHKNAFLDAPMYFRQVSAVCEPYLCCALDLVAVPV